MPDANSGHHDGSDCDGNQHDSERADSRGASSSSAAPSGKSTIDTTFTRRGRHDRSLCRKK
eukprot:2489688-Pleurochrysis_carterae.AAC.1